VSLDQLLRVFAASNGVVICEKLNDSSFHGKRRVVLRTDKRLTDKSFLPSKDDDDLKLTLSSLLDFTSINLKALK